MVLLPSDHSLTARDALSPHDLAGQPFIAMASKAKVLRAVIDDYLERSGVHIEPAQCVDNPAMVMSLIASIRGVTLIPAYVQNLMPWSVTSRKLARDVPTIDLVIGYDKANHSPALKLFLSQLEDVVARVLKGTS